MFVSNRKQIYAHELHVTRIALVFLYVDDVRTSQETFSLYFT
jgi:hypothetical protein